MGGKKAIQILLLPGNSEEVLACCEPLIPTYPIIPSPTLLSEMQQPSESMHFKPGTSNTRSTDCLQSPTGSLICLLALPGAVTMLQKQERSVNVSPKGV